jgi:hypothetical protein
MHLSLQRSALAVTLVVFAQGCGSSLSQPFDQMKGQPVRMLRLQNFEPPPPQPTAAAPSANLLPPQIQQWLSAGAQLLPPGLLPPGLLPGGTPAPTVQPDAPRFHGFRILGWMDVNDPKLRDEVLDIFGHDSNFTSQHGGCMFAEFGFSISQPNGQPPADLLVSLSCDNTGAFGFVWPYGPKTGVTSDASKRVVDLAKSVFGG